ncbi:hypothetical protein K7W42_13965 [Deinococcus sp. HMF7604]|uniref:Ig-like domain-containing protein n=1 Tax=Deinococcus betulae TaxID=2873312 RepID=UPI001CCA7DEF|nr:hypothetical protein [Deinococcus betulae]
MKRSARLALPLLTCTALLTACPGGGDGGTTPPPPPADTTAPTVTLQGVQSGRTLTLTASAQDAVGVARVDFFAGTTLLGSDTTAPYEARRTVSNADNGIQNFTAKAYDAAGNMSAAGTQVTVNVAPTLYQGVWGWGLVNAAGTFVDQGAVIFDDEGRQNGQTAALGIYRNQAETRAGYSLLGEITARARLETAFSFDENLNDLRFYFIGIDDDQQMGTFQGKAAFEGSGAIFNAAGEPTQDVFVLLIQSSTSVPSGLGAQSAAKAQARALVTGALAQRQGHLTQLKTNPDAVRNAARTFLK